MNSNIMIKKYTLDYRDKVIKFFKSLSFEDLYKRFHGSIGDIEGYVDSFMERNGIILLAVKNNQVIGICEAYPAEKSEWEVAIIVSREFRQMGVGKILMDKISDVVHGRGGTGIYGIIGRDNMAAILFGKSLGCKISDLDSYTVKVYFDLCEKFHEACSPLK